MPKLKNLNQLKVLNKERKSKKTLKNPDLMPKFNSKKRAIGGAAGRLDLRGGVGTRKPQVI